MEQRLSGVSLPTAAYEMALVVLKALQRRGIVVPQKVSLVGFDDLASMAF
ncbi:MAG: substrate-binding domain-containing protein [Armatimonadetes bacterium]|nr:substrate-binding domain-containing protein [Armatimonadota bacterium]